MPPTIADKRDKRRPGGVWSAFGRRLVGVWSAFGRCLVGVWSAFGRHLGGSQRLVGVWSAAVGAWSTFGRRQTSHTAFLSTYVLLCLGSAASHSTATITNILDMDTSASDVSLADFNESYRGRFFFNLFLVWSPLFSSYSISF